jgi:two-component system CheB/CheR fusion protein
MPHQGKRADGGPGELPTKVGRPLRAPMDLGAPEPAGSGHTPGIPADSYRDLFERAPIAYLVTDGDGLVQRINEAAASLLQVEPAAIAGTPLSSLVDPEQRNGLLDHLRRARHIDDPVRHDTTLRLASGAAVPVRIETRSPERRDECWSVLVEMTDRARLAADHEQALRLHADTHAKSEAKDQFLATLSHELRTPLTPALFAIAMLARMRPLPAGAAGLIGTIRRNLDLEVRLINDLLDLTRIERKKLDLDPVVVDVHELLRESVTACGVEAEAKRVSLEVDFCEQRPHVRADPLRIRQVFWNLLDNAVKFTPPVGRVRIQTTMNGQAVRIAVSDTGVGIEPGLIARLFLPFEQAATAERHANRGLGLGLAICKGVIDAHGGRIRGTSGGLGQGATFEVELDALPEPIAAPPPERTSRRGNEAAPMRVLVVEDHQDSAEMLKAVLATEGHQVQIAASGRAARSLCGGDWDVVICDLGLPDESGLQVGRWLRQQPHAPRYLIALSGYGARDDIESTGEAGFDLHLVKPVDMVTLIEVLRRVPR